MKALRRIAQLALIGLCLAPLARELVQDWSGVSALAAQLQALPLIAAGVLLVLSSLFLPVAIAAFTHGGRRPISFRDSAIAYFGSQPMKYLPGSFWILPGRVALLQRMGHDAGLSACGLAFEMTTQVLSAALVGAALLVGVGGFASAGVAGSVWAVLAGSLVVTGLLLASPTLVQRLRRGPARIAQVIGQVAEIPLAARLRSTALTVVAFGAMWLVMGASFYLMLAAAGLELNLGLLGTAIGISTLSWLAGFLAPFSPGGVGVREGAIVLLLGTLASGPEATLVALLWRALALAVEFGFALAAWQMLRSDNPGQTPGRSSVPTGKSALRTVRAPVPVRSDEHKLVLQRSGGFSRSIHGRASAK